MQMQAIRTALDSATAQLAALTRVADAIEYRGDSEPSRMEAIELHQAARAARLAVQRIEFPARRLAAALEAWNAEGEGEGEAEGGAE